MTVADIYPELLACCMDACTVEKVIKAIRAEALKDAGERAKKWMLDPEPGCSLLTAIYAGEVEQ
jgi:hypothetical protein